MVYELYLKELLFKKKKQKLLYLKKKIVSSLNTPPTYLHNLQKLNMDSEIGTWKGPLIHSLAWGWVAPKLPHTDCGLLVLIKIFTGKCPGTSIPGSS